MSHNKVKGLLKGLRYISNIFENEKDQPEMQIGLPTDVKHVAHIGWDGSSVNSPSWMNEFKAPEIGGGDIKHEASSIKSEDSSSKRSGRDPVLPKSTRRHSSTEEPTRERSEKCSTSRRSKHMNKDSSCESTKSKNSSEGGDVLKKSRRMKSRDSADGSSRSSRTSRRGHSSKSDAGSECGSMSKSIDNDNDNDNNNQEDSQSSCVNPSEGGQEKEHTGVS